MHLCTFTAPHGYLPGAQASLTRHLTSRRIINSLRSSAAASVSRRRHRLIFVQKFYKRAMNIPGLRTVNWILPFVRRPATNHLCGNRISRLHNSHAQNEHVLIIRTSLLIALSCVRDCSYDRSPGLLIYRSRAAIAILHLDCYLTTISPFLSLSLSLSLSLCSLLPGRR